LTDHKVFELMSAPLQSGVDFRNAKVSCQTYGQLAADKSNVIVVPSGYTLTHDEVGWLTSASKVLDRRRRFIISVSMLGTACLRRRATLSHRSTAGATRGSRSPITCECNSAW